MKIYARQITAYIEYLKEQGFTVTLHGRLISQSVFLKYNYHQNPYCHYIKTVYGRWEECICRQKKVKEKCKDGSFFGCCYAGVGEYVYPVDGGDGEMCFISVSGFFCPETLSRAAHFAAVRALDKSELSVLAEKYLVPEIPPKEKVDAVMEPLVFMLERYFAEQRESERDETLLYHRILRYVTENCHQKLTMKALAAHFNYSVSTLSHLFYKNSGKSLPAYIDDLRLEEAQWYLANSKTGITEIALFLGYSSSGYFSSAFKKKFGLSPREYRRLAHLK